MVSSVVAAGRLHCNVQVCIDDDDDEDDEEEDDLDDAAAVDDGDYKDALGVAIVATAPNVLDWFGAAVTHPPYPSVDDDRGVHVDDQEIADSVDGLVVFVVPLHSEHSRVVGQSFLADLDYYIRTGRQHSSYWSTSAGA